MQRSVEECKKMLIKLAIKHAVAPKLISERLLSDDDKKDMLDGLVTFQTLDSHVKTWKEYGMCNYANGSGDRYGDFGSWGTLRVGSDKKVATIEDLTPRN